MKPGYIVTRGQNADSRAGTLHEVSATCWPYHQCESWANSVRLRVDSQGKHVLGYLYLILVVLGKGCYIFTLSRPNLLFLR